MARAEVVVEEDLSMSGVISLTGKGRLAGAKRALSATWISWAMVLASATASQATWIGIYAFEKNGNLYDVVVTASGDSLNDLFLSGYDGLDLGSFVSIEAVLDVGTQTSTGAIQDQLVRAMAGQPGYGSLANPGSIRMVYNADTDYRYLYESYGSGVVEDETLDYSAAVSDTLGYVVNRGVAAVPEPNVAVLLGLGLAGLSMTLRRNSP